jgi:hypothetical protein
MRKAHLPNPPSPLPISNFSASIGQELLIVEGDSGGILYIETIAEPTKP